MSVPDSMTLSAIEALTLPVVLVDRALNVRFANVAARRYFAEAGRFGEDVSDQDIAAVLRAETRLVDAVARAMYANRPVSVLPERKSAEAEAGAGELFRLCRLGEDADGPVLLLEINDKIDALRRIRLMNRDLASVRAKSLEVRRNLRRLSILNKNLSQFAHAAAHDMQEPVRVIALLSDILLEKSDSIRPERRREHLRSIGVHARRARRIVMDVLQFSSVSERVPTLEEGDMGAVLERVVAAFQEDMTDAEQVGKGAPVTLSLTLRGPRRSGSTAR